MRADSIGLFWEDLPTPKREPKEKEVKIIPPAVWLADDYLPGLEDAKKFDVDLINDSELVMISLSSENSFIFDIEIFQNYSLFAMMHEQSERVVYFESFNDETLNIPKLKWVMENLLLVGFNSSHFDIPIANLMINGCSNAQLKEAANLIIETEYRTDDVYKQFGVKPLKNINHIDLISLVPKDTSLKLCGGRIHTKRMQDLPYPPDRILNRDQADVIRWYCINDLRTTLDLKRTLKEQLDLRVAMSNEYKVDLRSKSDAQIAEAVISKAVSELNGYRAKRPIIAPGTTYKFQPLRYLNYKSDLMKWVYNQVLNADYVVAESGKVLIPEAIEKLEIKIGKSCYTMGNGGLHSTEKSICHKSDDDHILIDRDVESYYPRIILNQGLFPQHLGKNFLPVYNNIVVRRLDAKKNLWVIIAGSLKIVINGSFGKLGSKYSILYAPDLMIQVTLTGQLSLLLLIELLELNGFEVISANTDGVVIKCKRSRRTEFEQIVKEWELATGFKTEETEYSALYSRDVNNYIAVKPDGKTKRKGVYRPGELSKNPANEICTDSVVNFLTRGIPIEQTITTCNDVRSFLSIRQVRGGGVRIRKGENNELIENEYLGKSIRWYYAKDSGGEIVYAKNGNSVPRSEGAKPLMLLPDNLPQDIDYEWYINESYSILEDIGYSNGST